MYQSNLVVLYFLWELLRVRLKDELFSFTDFPCTVTLEPNALWFLCFLFRLFQLDWSSSPAGVSGVKIPSKNASVQKVKTMGGGDRGQRTKLKFFTGHCFAHWTYCNSKLETVLYIETFNIQWYLSDFFKKETVWMWRPFL